MSAFATLIAPVRTSAAPRAQQPRLIDTVAHELRNPLASLRLSLDALLNDFDELEPESALRLLRRAHRSASWLQTLTDNLTSAACIEAGALDVHPQLTDLHECVEDAVLLVRGLLEQRGQKVKYTSSTSIETVMADRGRVVQIIANLLSNASRYSVPGDEIEVHISSVGRQVRVRVTDHGPGISPADQERIFGAWTRLDGAAPGGLGLGLSIVRSLVQQHGGRIGVESRLGAGATFWFTLDVEGAPLAAPRAMAETPLSARETEVAELVARGYSNRQIAHELVVSDRTVDTHVCHILRKLELSSRAQIAAWVVTSQPRLKRA